MSLWIENKYTMILSSRLRNFKRKDAVKGLYNFSCPICGDSNKKKTKARGYIYSHKGRLKFKCHNCNASMFFKTFLKKLDMNLYTEFIKECLTENNETLAFEAKMKTPSFVKDSPLKSLVKVSSLPENHIAKIYVTKRQIPTKFHYKLFYTENYRKWVNTFNPGKFENTLKEDPRIVIPYIDEFGRLIAVQGRTLGDSRARYITAIIDDDAPRIFGMDAVNKNRTVYAFEGPFDSMFFDNAIAVGSSSLKTYLPLTGIEKENIIVVFDNEYRNVEILKAMRSCIAEGYRICIWPENFEYKDINEAVLAGFSPEWLKRLVDQNTASGLEASLKFEVRKKNAISSQKESV